MSWGRERPTDAVPERPDAADPTAGVDLRLSLLAALRRLPAGQRTVVVLRYFEDLPEADVAR